MTLVLCLDGGSSSLKFALYSADERGELVRLMAGELPAGNTARETFANVLSTIAPEHEAGVAAVAHRIVFGGSRYTATVIADDATLRELETLVPIEPLHLRAELDLVHEARHRLRGTVQVLCFDTAFHQRMPAIAKRLPLPRDLDPLIARYGFHGLSYEYVVSVLPRDCGRTIVAHLGSGASLCALRDGVPVDTTMGFSALGGLMMATRPGDLDPGILLRLLAAGYDLSRLTRLLYHESGLRGVSGISADMRSLLANRQAPAAREAVDLFVYQLVKHLGAMIAVLGGLDTLVFTGGIGEHAPTIRAAACGAFEYMGLRLDDGANARNAGRISTEESGVAVLVVPTDENLVLARHAMNELGIGLEKVL